MHRAQVIGRIEDTTGIAPVRPARRPGHDTGALHLRAPRVLGLDNGCSHNGQASVRRMATAYPTATLVHLPVHASWLNQVEIYSSVLQRKAIERGDFIDLDALAARVMDFEALYNQTAKPFDWKYTRTDLPKTASRLNLAA